MMDAQQVIVALAVQVAETMAERDEARRQRDALAKKLADLEAEPSD